MPRASRDGIEIEYETFGQPGDPPLLLINGLGSQLVNFEVEFCEGFVDRGFFVIRFDNRDVGLSTKFDDDVDVLTVFMETMAGKPVEAPYLLADMATDAVSVLDDLGLERAHVLGVSLGGMIAQTMAIDHPERVASLTSIMSSTGDPDVGGPDPDLVPLLLETTPDERDAYIDHAIADAQMLAGPDHFDPERARHKAERAYDRCFFPQGSARQLVAILASGSRSNELRRLDVKALVIHGDADRLVDVSGGERTAECLAGSELLILEGMGHDLAPFFWARVIAAVTALAARAGT